MIPSPLNMAQFFKKNCTPACQARIIGNVSQSMMVVAFVLCLCSTASFATTIEYRVVKELREREVHIRVLLSQVRADHRDDRAFVSALDSAQAKWEEYCVAMLELRFPDEKKREEYGSAYQLAYVTAKNEMLDGRIKDLLSWIESTKRQFDETPNKTG